MTAQVGQLTLIGLIQMSNTKNLANLAAALDDGTNGQVLQSTGSGGVAFADAGGSGTTIHDTLSAMTAAATPDEGTLHYNKQNDTLYVKAPSGFFAIATITNSSPTFDSNGISQTTGSSTTTIAADGSFTLTAGTNTVVTINASDVDVGQTLTYTATLQSGTQANVLQSFTQGTGSNTNVFTLVPAASGAGGTITYRFSVTDSTNAITRDCSFLITFAIQNSRYTRLFITTDNTTGDNQSITYINASGSTSNFTVNGDSLAGSFSPYKESGYSVFFDGASNQALTFGTTTEHDFETGAFTIEFFIYPTEASNLDIYLSAANNGSTQIGYYQGNVRKLYFYNNVDVINSTDEPTVGAWNHIALTRNSSGSTALFLNSVRQGSATSHTSNVSFSGLNIGKFHLNNSYMTYGYISDLRFVKGSNVYDPDQSTLTQPTERLTAITNTTLLTCHLPYIADGSSTKHGIALVGSPSTSPIAPYDNSEYSETANGGSISFDGDADSLQFTASADLQALGRTGTAATIEAWVYLNSAPSSNGTAIYSLGTVGSTGGNNVLSFEIQNNRTLRALVSGAYDVTAGNTAAISTGTVPLKVWTHCALVLNSGTWTIYLNGSADGTSTGNYPSGTNHSTAFIGRVFYDNGRDADMFVSDLRITSDAQYTSNFTPPTAPLTTVSNTKLHVKGTDAHILDKAQTSNLKLYGGLVSTTNPAKFSSTASFDFGGNDYIESSTSPIYNIGTQPFTLECFFRPINTNNQGSLVYLMNGSSNVFGTFIYHTNNSLGVYDDSWITGNAGSGSNHNILSGGTWYYMSIARDSSTLRVYLDGSQIFSEANTNNYTTNKMVVGGGHEYTSGTYLNGHIQDVRLTIGFARYTGSSHTVPSEPLKG